MVDVMTVVLYEKPKKAEVKTEVKDTKKNAKDTKKSSKK